MCSVLASCAHLLHLEEKQRLNKFDAFRLFNLCFLLRAV